ncbi:MAG: hypothetical protein KDB40_13380 [Acidimicrobiales bacterium]|nr:hypothetical protein [Acidimicrobiales bacterium]MCB9392523.1 hypothetical protein [Acidimicrobiaceae bacterium]
MASRAVASLAVLCASLSWAGWVFLHTIGDPTRAEDVATAVLDDPRSREQIATSFALQFVRASGIERSNIDLVEQTIDTALGDPRVSTDVIAAFGAAHANALGVDDERDTTIDTNAMLTSIREQLAAVDPELATQLPDGVLPAVTLPTFHPPGVESARRVAESATAALAIAAAALAVVAFAFGDRRGVLRRIGLWGVVSGVAWVLLPIAVVAGARAWASDVDGIVEAAVRASVDDVVPVAVALVVGGVIALVLSFVPALWGERDAGYRRPSAVQQRVQVHPAAHHPAPHQPGVPHQTPPSGGAGAPAARPAWPTDSYQPAPATRPSRPSPFPAAPARVDPTPPAGHPSSPSHGQPVAGHPAAHQVTPRTPPAPTPVDEIDPWSSYFGPDAR